MGQERDAQELFLYYDEWSRWSVVARDDDWRSKTVLGGP